VSLLGLSGCVYRDGQIVRSYPWDGDSQIVKQTTNPNYVAFESIETYSALYNYDDSFRLTEPVHKTCKPVAGGGGSGAVSSGRPGQHSY
jgi:hypothetical protein